MQILNTASPANGSTYDHQELTPILAFVQCSARVSLKVALLYLHFVHFEGSDTARTDSGGRP